MRTNKSEKKHAGRFTLRAKITLMFGVVIVIMLIPLFMMVKVSNDYINRYDQVLSNISKIDYIKKITELQPQRILNYCIINRNIDESEESEKIVTMMQYINDIKYEINTDEEYAQNLAQAVVVEKLLENYLQNYRAGIGLCKGNFSLAGDTKFYTMNDISDYVSRNCSLLMSLEMQRSEDIQRQIAQNYKNMRVNIYIMLFVVILVAVVLVVLLQKKVAVPISLLSRKLGVIADKDLSDATVSVRSKDEIGDLAYVFNAMSSNLKDILMKVSNVSNDVENSFYEVTQNVEDTAKGSDDIAKKCRIYA